MLDLEGLSFILTTSVSSAFGLMGLYYSIKLFRLYRGGAFEGSWLYISTSLAFLSAWVFLLFMNEVLNLSISWVIYWIGFVGGLLLLLGVMEQVRIWEWLSGKVKR